MFWGAKVGKKMKKRKNEKMKKEKRVRNCCFFKKKGHQIKKTLNSQLSTFLYLCPQIFIFNTKNLITYVI